MSGKSSEVFEKMTCLYEASAIVHSLGFDTTVLRQAYGMLAEQIFQQSAVSPHRQQRGRPTKPDVQRILELLAKHPNGLTRREIQQRLVRKVAEIEPVLQHMLAAGGIATIQAGRTVAYVLRDEEPRA